MINLEKEEEKKRKKTLEIHKRKIEEIINNQGKVYFPFNIIRRNIYVKGKVTKGFT